MSALGRALPAAARASVEIEPVNGIRPGDPLTTLLPGNGGALAPGQLYAVQEIIPGWEPDPFLWHCGIPAARAALRRWALKNPAPVSISYCKGHGWRVLLGQDMTEEAQGCLNCTVTR